MPARRLLSSLEVKRAFNREECFGFPTGITGHALADRAFVQAQKFGAHTGIPCEDACGISLDNNWFVRTGNDLHDANMLSISLQTSVEGISPMAIFAWGRPGVSRRQWVKAQSGNADTGVSVSRLLNKLAGCSETAEERKQRRAGSLRVS